MFWPSRAAPRAAASRAAPPTVPKKPPNSRPLNSDPSPANRMSTPMTADGRRCNPPPPEHQIHSRNGTACRVNTMALHRLRRQRLHWTHERGAAKAARRMLSAVPKTLSQFGRFLKEGTLGRSVFLLLAAAITLLLLVNISTFVLIQRTASLQSAGRRDLAAASRRPGRAAEHQGRRDGPARISADGPEQFPPGLRPEPPGRTPAAGRPRTDGRRRRGRSGLGRGPDPAVARQIPGDVEHHRPVPARPDAAGARPGSLRARQGADGADGHRDRHARFPARRAPVRSSRPTPRARPSSPSSSTPWPGG